MTYASAVLGGDRKAMAALIRAIDDGVRDTTADLSILFSHGGKARIVGVTGSGGVGKSTLIDALLTRHRRREQRVGVLAVDPSSAVSGGALLGDRIRMNKHAVDEGVFIHSLSTRGLRGGLSRAVASSLVVLQAAGFDRIYIETVGTGQSESDVTLFCDTTVVVTSPLAGDDTQSMKAGVIELADVVAVNKKDLGHGRASVESLRVALDMTTKDRVAWQAPVLEISALNGDGLDELERNITAHGAYLKESGGARTKARERWRALILTLVSERVRDLLLENHAQSLHDAVHRIAERGSDPFSEAEGLLQFLIRR